MTEFAVRYDQLESTAGDIKNSSQAIVGRMDDLKAKFNGIAWEGNHRENYNNVQRQIEQSVATMNELLAKMGELVTAARELYSSTEQRQAQVWT